MTISIAAAKKLINDASTSDEEAALIIDECRELAEILFEQWMQDRKEFLQLKNINQFPE